MARILIIDDEPDTADLLGRWLRLRGHEPLAADYSETALRLARDERPALILLSVRLSSSDALDACRRLRSQPETRPAPVILTNVASAVQGQIQALQSGAADFVAEPIMLDDLGLRIGALLNGAVTPLERQQIMAGDVARTALDGLGCAAVWLLGVSRDSQSAVGLGMAAAADASLAGQESFAISEADWLGRVAATGIAAFNLPFDEVTVALDPVYQTLRDLKIARANVLPVRSLGGKQGLFVIGSPDNLDIQSAAGQAALTSLLSQARLALDVENVAFSETPSRRPVAPFAAVPITELAFAPERLPAGEIDIARDLPLPALADRLDDFADEEESERSEPSAAVWAPAVIGALREAAQALQGQTPDEALARILAETARSVNAGLAALALRVDHDSPELAIQSAVGPGAAKLIGMTLPIEGTLAGRAVESGELRDSEDGLPDGLAGALDEPLENALAAPVIGRGEIAGALLAINRKAGSFDEQDADTLRAMAALIGAAIDQARLKHETQRLQRELDLLREASPDAASRRANQLEAAYSEIKEADRAKNQIIQNVSRELRAPLTEIMGYADMILSEEFGPVTGEQKEGLALIGEKSRQITHLVDEALAVRHVQHEPLNRTAISIEAVANMAAQAMRSQADKAGVTLETLCADFLPQVYADRDRLFLAFENLLSNAIKFSPLGGKVTLTIWDSGSAVQVEVADRGAGIPPEDQEKIWQQFYRAEGDKSAGLGLAVVKQVVEQHQGKVWVKSKPGEGSVFFFTIPRAEIVAADENFVPEF